MSWESATKPSREQARVYRPLYSHSQVFSFDVVIGMLYIPKPLLGKTHKVIVASEDTRAL